MTSERLLNVPRRPNTACITFCHVDTVLTFLYNIGVHNCQLLQHVHLHLCALKARRLRHWNMARLREARINGHGDHQWDKVFQLMKPGHSLRILTIKLIESVTGERREGSTLRNLPETHNQLSDIFLPSQWLAFLKQVEQLRWGVQFKVVDHEDRNVDMPEGSQIAYDNLKSIMGKPNSLLSRDDGVERTSR